MQTNHTTERRPSTQTTERSVRTDHTTDRRLSTQCAPITPQSAHSQDWMMVTTMYAHHTCLGVLVLPPGSSQEDRSSISLVPLSIHPSKHSPADRLVHWFSRVLRWFTTKWVRSRWKAGAVALSQQIREPKINGSTRHLAAVVESRARRLYTLSSLLLHAGHSAKCNQERECLNSSRSGTSSESAVGGFR